MRHKSPPLLCCALVSVSLAAFAQHGDWPAYGRDAGGERFSPLDQINRNNVPRLQVAWTYRAATGKLLWRGDLPTSARATPMTYLGRDGRQYVVIAAGGHGVQIGPPLGDYVVAFALAANR